MKKKNLWLAVVTLVLCLGVMATGVYAVRSAMLNLGGSLGFNMSDAIVEVSGTISNIAQANYDGTFDKVNKTINKGIIGGEDTVTTNISLGALHFFKGEMMEFELTFKNLGAKALEGNINISYSNTNVQVYDGDGYDTLPLKLTISPNQEYTVLFALELIDQTVPVSNFNFNIAVNFEEYKLIKNDETGYFIEMGEYTNTEGVVVPLRWYPFAKVDENGNVLGTLSDDTFSYKDELEAGAYYFISEYVLANKAFRAEGEGGANSMGYTDTIENHYGLDYNGSTIQKYITGDMLTEYRISDDLVYNIISKRTLLGQSYQYYNASGNDVTTDDNITNETPNQSLWLLCNTEYSYLESTPSTVASIYGYPIGSTSAVCWWIRAPFRVWGNHSFADAGGADSSGYVYWEYSYNAEFGVRPAFQITIE